LTSKKCKTIFPSPDTIYRTINIIDKERPNKNNSSKNKKIQNKTETLNLNNSKSSPLKNKEKKEINNKYQINDNKNYENEEESYDEEEEEEDEIDNNENKSNNNYEEKNNNIKTNTNNKAQQQVEKRKKLFLNTEKSRFDFCVKNSDENRSINIPRHIYNLIDKKIILNNLTKHMQQKIIDKIFLNESIKEENKGKNDDWTKFIKDNIESNNFNYNNDELVNDIDNINHFILNKATSQICTDNK
jgi:hypothetical protein